MSEQLKPCPFCGKSDVSIFHPGSGVFEASCDNCGAMSGRFFREEEAIAAWNKRASGWISVKDRLPETYGSYLVALKSYGGRYHIMRKQFLARGWTMKRDERALNEKVTHWMPLPPSPGVGIISGKNQQ